MSLRISLAAVAFLIAALLLPTSIPARAAEGAGLSLEELGNLGGSTQAVAVRMPTLLLGEGTNLVTAELRGGPTPRIRARLALPGHPQAISIAGTVAFVKTATYADGYAPAMQVVDIQDLSRPKLIGSYLTSVLPDADRRMIYIAEFDGLHIVDVSDPLQPVERGRYATQMYPRQVVFYLSTLTLTEGNRLHVIDVTDPSQPTLLGLYEFPTSIEGLILRNSLAYLVGGTVLQVVDISDPHVPTLRQQLTLPNTARAITIDTTTIYITAAVSASYFGIPTTLLLVDVSEPMLPTLKGSFEVPSGIVDVEPTLEVTLVAAKDSLLILDTNRPGPPILRGQYYPPGAITDLQVDINGLAYLAVDGRGLEIVATNGTSPGPVGGLRLLGHPHKIKVAGGLAAVLDDTSFWVLDLHVPAKPVALYQAELGVDSTNISAPWIDSNGNLTYIGYQHTVQIGGQATQQADILIIDTGVQPPVVVGRTTIALLAGARFARFARVNNIILLASGTDEIVLIDARDPLRPVHAGALFVPAARDVQTVGTRAYVLGGEGNIRIFELEAAGPIHLLGVYDASGVVTSMRVVGTWIYLSDEAGFEIVDIANPAAPERSTPVADGIQSTQIDVISDRAYLTGFWAVPLSGISGIVTTIAVGDPLHPKLLGQNTFPSGRAVAFNDSVLIVVSGQRFPIVPHNGHLNVFRRFREAETVWADGRELFAPPTDVAVEGSRIYVADNASGLRMYSLHFLMYLPSVQT